MASSPLSLSLLLLLVISISNAVPTPSRPGGKTDVPDVEKIPGGKTNITNVANNIEVQGLGRFSVEEHNKRNPNDPLSFVRVLEAQYQVVRGTKYYLRIAATDAQGKPATFDAQVLVPPVTKELLSFTPSKPGQ